MTIETVELNAGSGGATVAVDTVSGKSYQIVKIDVGADGSEALLGSSNPIPVSDAGGALTVDGTVAVTNAGLTELAAAINGSSQMDVNIAASNATVAVSNAGLTELAAAINASSQVDVNIAASGATVPVSNAGITTIAGAVSGTEMQVDVLTMPTVTVNAHAVTNTGTFATQVDGAALTALQLLDNIVAVEDAVAGSGFSGVPFLAVRQDSHSDLAADGDFIAPTIDADGGLRVSIVAGAGSGGTAVADDADFTDGTTSLTPIGGVYESSPSTVTDGDIGMAGITQTRALKVHVASGGVSGIVDDAAFTAGTSEGVLMMGVASSDSVDANDAGAIAMTTARAMHVAVQSIAAGNNNIGDVDVATLPAVAGGAAQDAAITGNPVPIGLRASTATPTAMSGDGDVVYPWATREGAQVIAGAIVDDAAFTPGTSRVVPIAFQADETATDSVDEGDAGAPRMTLDRKVITTSYAHAAAGGWTPHKNLDVDESEDDIKTSPGKLGWIHVINLSNAVRYIKFYNATAANVTVGTTTPVLSFPVPTMADTNGAGFVVSFGDAGVQFDTAICVAATTGLADNNTGAPGANEVVLNCGYL